MKTGMTVLLVIFLMAGSLFAQVHIRENVNISPGRGFTAQVAWPSGIILFCRSSVSVTITGGYDNLMDPLTNMELVLVSPETMSITADALHSVNQTWTSPEFQPGSILKFVIVEHHACSGMVDTVAVGTPGQWSIFDSTFSLKAYGAYSRCNITQDLGWSGLSFNVRTNTTVKDIVVRKPGIVHFGLFWWSTDGSVDSELVRLEILGPCPAELDTFFQSRSGAITGAIEAEVAGSYAFNASILKDNSVGTNAIYYLAGDTGSSDWMIGEGGVPHVDQAGSWSPMSFSLQPSFTTQYSSKFSLFLSPLYGDCLKHGEGAFISVGAVLDCSNTKWFLTDPLTLRIISGVRYASLHFYEPGTWNEVQGPVITMTGTDILSGLCTLIADGESPDSVTWVVVTAQGPGGFSVDSLVLTPPDVVVAFNPTVVSPGDTAEITVKKRQVDGSLVDFPDWQRYEVGVWSGEGYGSVLLPDESMGEYFEGVAGPFRFVAADSIDRDSVAVAVRVGTEEPILGSAAPAGKRRTMTVQGGMSSRRKSVSDQSSFYWADFGIEYVKIKTSYSLKILDHYPWSIWPSLPSTRLGTSRGGDVPGYDPVRSFHIHVADADGNPVQGVPVQITHEYVQGSGGHAHAGAGASPVPDQSLQGIFWGQGGHGPSLLLITDARGVAVVDSLVASQISGKYVITACLGSNPLVKDTVNLNVMVPGLVNFRDLIYLPENEKPYVFDTTPAYGPNHVDNDWCTAAMGNSFFAGILDFNFWSASEEGGGVPIKISINDMSLPWGGAFDYKGTWNVDSAHTFHRVGLSVDINHNKLTDAQIDQLSFSMRNHGGELNSEYPFRIHFGFFNGGN